MTIDEAVYAMEYYKLHFALTPKAVEAFDMAIKALEQQPTDAVDRVTIKEYLYSLGMGIKVTSTDAVDRQEAINAAIDGADKWDGGYNNEREKCIREEIAKLPPVTPQKKMGHWIEHFDESGKWYECDQCHTDWGGSFNYCPNCGAKM